MQSRNARPLTARSVVASTLLGTTPPRLPALALVRAAALFGISEGTTRVALSRMVGAGELVSDDGWYELAGPALLARQARQLSSRAPATTDWSGGWLVAVVTAERRAAAERAELRDALRRARLGELREGVWLRPDNLAVEWPPVVAEQCTTMAATGVDDDLAGRLWDLGAWAGEAAHLRRTMRPLLGPLERGDTGPLAEGFVVSAAVLRLLSSDPLLPPALLPARWPGRALRDDYDRFDAAYRSVLRAWFRANAT